MSPDQIPASIVASFMTAPFVSVSPTEHINLTEPDTRAVLAHFWPAIERHVTRQLADLLEQRNPDRSADFSEGVDWAVDELRAHGTEV